MHIYVSQREICNLLRFYLLPPWTEADLDIIPYLKQLSAQSLMHVKYQQPIHEGLCVAQ